MFMEINKELNNQIIDDKDKTIIKKLVDNKNLDEEVLYAMIREELAHQGMARRVGLINKIHNLIKQKK